MADYDPKMIEAVARAICGDVDPAQDRLGPMYEDDGRFIEARKPRWSGWVEEAVCALRALPLPPEALNALWRGEAVVVPKVPTEPMQAKGHDARSDPSTGLPTHCGTDEIYAAMLAASPYKE